MSEQGYLCEYSNAGLRWRSGICRGYIIIFDPRFYNTYFCKVSESKDVALVDKKMIKYIE